MLEGRRIGFVGGGQMCEAILRGALDSGRVRAEDVSVADVNDVRLSYLKAEYGVAVFNSGNEGGLGELTARSDVLVFAVKPQFTPPVLAQTAALTAPETPVFSIMGGVNLATLEGYFESNPVVRVMPNTPAQVRKGSSGIAAGKNTGKEVLALAEELFSLVGSVYVIPEKLIDPLTGLSGCGPAFACLFMEALADGGVEKGLPRDMALKLAAETLAGTAEMMLQTGKHPAQLKDAVTSPGGGTIAGVHALESGGLRAAVMDAVDRSCERMAEIARETGE